MGAMMRMALMIAIGGTMLMGVASTPGHADVRYITDGPGMIEITGSDYDLWKAGNLVPRANLPHGPCVPIIQGGCHCPNPNASGTVTSEGRIVLVARRVDVCPGILPPGSLAGNATVPDPKREDNVHGFTASRFGPNFTEWERDDRTNKRRAKVKWTYSGIPSSLAPGQKVVIQVTGGVVEQSPPGAGDGLALSGVVTVYGDVDIAVAQQADRGHPVGRYEFVVRPNARAVEIHLGGSPAGTGAIWTYIR